MWKILLPHIQIKSGVTPIIQMHLFHFLMRTRSFRFSCFNMFN